MEGKLNKTANGFKSYDISKVEQDYLFILADILTKQFGFHMASVPISGLDGVYWAAIKQNIELTVGWDIWSGAFVMANCIDGNEYVEKIAAYLST